MKTIDIINEGFKKRYLKEGRLESYRNRYLKEDRYKQYNDARSITHDDIDSDVYYSVEGEYRVYRKFGSKEEAWNYYLDKQEKLPKKVHIREIDKSTGNTNWSETFVSGKMVEWEEGDNFGTKDFIANPEWYKQYLDLLKNYQEDQLDKITVPQYLSCKYKSKIEESYKKTKC